MSTFDSQLKSKLEHLQAKSILVSKLLSTACTALAVFLFMIDDGPRGLYRLPMALSLSVMVGINAYLWSRPPCKLFRPEGPTTNQPQSP
jgi:hypothetical protein